MSSSPPDHTQRGYARLAGAMYLCNYATAVFGALTPPSIAGRGDFAERARGVLASEHLYRAALASMAVSWVLIVLLAFALYVTLAPVHRRVAQIALAMELGQAFVGAVTVVFSLVVLGLYTSAQTAGPLGGEQLSPLVRVVGSAAEGGFNIAMMFFSPGSCLFFYLFYRSGYIPRPLAALGVFGSVMMGLVSVAGLIIPEHQDAFKYAAWAPMGVAETTTALWLVLKGVRSAPAPVSDLAAA